MELQISGNTNGVDIKVYQLKAAGPPNFTPILSIDNVTDDSYSFTLHHQGQIAVYISSVDDASCTADCDNTMITMIDQEVVDVSIDCGSCKSLDALLADIPCYEAETSACINWGDLDGIPVSGSSICPTQNGTATATITKDGQIISETTINITISGDCDDCTSNTTAGTPCNDGEDCTTGDHLDECGNCVGVYTCDNCESCDEDCPDADGDGICDDNEDCHRFKELRLTKKLSLSILASNNPICVGEPIELSILGLESFGPIGSILWNTGEVSDKIVITPSQTTTYSVTVTTIDGCSESISILITVQSINYSVMATNTTTCSIPGWSEEICITNLSDPAASIKWNTGSTSNNINVKPTNTTTYKVTVTNALGCSLSKSITINVNQNCDCYNPLTIPLSIVASGGGANLEGGYLGCTRTGSTNCTAIHSTNGYQVGSRLQRHNGIDIFAPVGTNIYNMFEGTIAQSPTTTFKPQNPAYIGTNYDVNGVLTPIGSSGGRNGCDYASGSLGNSVIIKVDLTKTTPGNQFCDVAGAPVTDLYIRYCHLDIVTLPSLSVGTIVKQGDLIGIAGCSGNAAILQNILHHHLHLEVGTSLNNVFGSGHTADVDPLKFLCDKIQLPWIK